MRAQGYDPELAPLKGAVSATGEMLEPVLLFELQLQ